MYRVLIVDDEAPIRDGLKCIMDWETLGFSICGEASNGQEALSLILSLNPDLVLMDIHMPKMQGLTVVKKAREQDYKGRFIIISGYSNFNYAQEAIRHGVEGYLTKPVDKDALLEVVAKIKLALDRENRNQDNIELLKQKARYVILHELMTGKTPEEDFSKEEIADLELYADVYQVVIYENFSHSSESQTYSFADLLKFANRDDHTLNHFEEDLQDVILLKGSYAINRFNDFLNYYHGQTPPQEGSPMDSLFIAYGRPVTSLSEIHLSYEDAHELITRRFFCVQGQHTLGYKELPDILRTTHTLEPEMLSAYTDHLVGYLQTFNRKNVAGILSDLEAYLYNAGSDISRIRLFLTDLYLRIKEKISLVYNTISLPFPTNSMVIDFINKKYYLYEILQFFSEQFEMIMNATGNSTRNSILDDILYYIDHNYQSNIKLESIAPLFGYNSAYLGKIFNKTVGESFNSYVDQIRIEHSKELLLAGNYKVYEIAERVGYRNVDYFHKKFRKYVGESPAEFRKKNGGTAEE